MPLIAIAAVMITSASSASKAGRRGAARQRGRARARRTKEQNAILRIQAASYRHGKYTSLRAVTAAPGQIDSVAPVIVLVRPSSHSQNIQIARVS